MFCFWIFLEGLKGCFSGSKEFVLLIRDIIKGYLVLKTNLQSFYQGVWQWALWGDFTPAGDIWWWIIPSLKPTGRAFQVLLFSDSFFFWRGWWFYSKALLEGISLRDIWCFKANWDTHFKVSKNGMVNGRSAVCQKLKILEMEFVRLLKIDT